MKVFSQLVRAQVENKGSDYAGATAKGLVWINTSSNLVKFDDGTAVRTLVTTDNTQTLTNKTWNGAVIAEAYGGTNQSTYTQGDILYASAANTLSKLAKGTNGQFLKIGATIPEWATITSTLGVKTKAFADSPYTILAGDDLILVDTSGGAVTLTLPASSGGGKVYRVKKTTSDFTAITVARAGSDTIQDVATGGTSATLHTQGEEISIVDATSGVWQVFDRRIPSVWTTYTPSSTQGFGTISSDEFFWRRSGDSVQISGRFTAGTLNAATEARVNLPTGLTVHASKVDTNDSVVGVGARNAVSAEFIQVLANGDDAYMRFAKSSGSESGLSPINSDGMMGNNEQLGFNATIPITGWNG